MVPRFATTSNTDYSWLLLAATTLSLVFWVRLARRDSRLLLIWLAALLGAFTGAKGVYLAAEGWRHWGQPDAWAHLRTGKSILGALLGGYAAVEGMKKLLGYSSATGDWFAQIVPLGIALGRLGCWLNGCCLGQVCETSHWWTLRDAIGIHRWPSVPLEFGFNLAAWLTLLALKHAGRFQGNLFHLYLIAYGLFRFAHEFVRDTPRMLGPLSGYAIVALVLTAFGILRFRSRQQAPPSLRPQ